MVGAGPARRQCELMMPLGPHCENKVHLRDVAWLPRDHRAASAALLGCHFVLHVRFAVLVFGGLFHMHLLHSIARSNSHRPVPQRAATRWPVWPRAWQRNLFAGTQL